MNTNTETTVYGLSTQPGATPLYLGDLLPNIIGRKEIKQNARLYGTASVNGNDVPIQDLYFRSRGNQPTDVYGWKRVVGGEEGTPTDQLIYGFIVSREPKTVIENGQTFSTGAQGELPGTEDFNLNQIIYLKHDDSEEHPVNLSPASSGQDIVRGNVIVPQPIIVPGERIFRAFDEVIPGSPEVPMIPGLVGVPTITYSREQEPIRLGSLPNLKQMVNGELLSPVVTSIRSFSNNSITVNIAFLIQQEELIPEEDFNFYYNITFDSAGGDLSKGQQIYKPMIFVEFNAPRNQNDQFVLYMYSVTFAGDFIPAGGSRSIPFDDVSFMEVMLVNQNPRTSRGTVTTVRSGDGEDSNSTSMEKDIFRKGLSELFKFPYQT